MPYGYTEQQWSNLPPEAKKMVLSDKTRVAEMRNREKPGDKKAAELSEKKTLTFGEVAKLAKDWQLEVVKNPGGTHPYQIIVPESIIGNKEERPGVFPLPYHAPGKEYTSGLTRAAIKFVRENGIDPHPQRAD